jgi:hypothetical protein|tara:strand:- start:154 stop:357 length:204 start_codon:yes stop_codon:yes gene_type:complete
LVVCTKTGLLKPKKLSLSSLSPTTLIKRKKRQKRVKKERALISSHLLRCCSRERKKEKEREREKERV